MPMIYQKVMTTLGVMIYCTEPQFQSKDGFVLHLVCLKFNKNKNLKKSKNAMVIHSVSTIL